MKSTVIRKMVEDDRENILKMMRVFYASDAVATNGSEEIFKADIDACVSGSPYLEGYVFLKGECAVGYGMIAKSFSTEYGKSCIWVEDIYLLPEYRHCGIGSAFFEHIEGLYTDSIFRLEVEAENENAIAAYKRNGFDFMPYLEMKK